jgi:hypothetical protein
MFEPTRPLGEPDLMRASAFQRYLDEMAAAESADPIQGRLNSLPPSLLQDLIRFERGGSQSEVLEVLAASVRHASELTLHLQWQDRVVPLTVFPGHKLAYLPLPMEDFLGERLSELKVMQVEPAIRRPPGDSESALIGEPHLYASMTALLWSMAMRGARDTLLPEIAGIAAYRIAPGADLRGLDLPGALSVAVERLQRDSFPLRAIADWPGMDRARASRLLNALYLLAGLIVSRTHPAASNDNWFGAR